MPMRRRGTHKSAIEASLRILRLHVFCSLYPGMASRGSGDWRLYWARVHQSFGNYFGDVGRETWAAALDADARAAAIRRGKRTPRQHEAARAAVTAANHELRAPPPRRALHAPRVRRVPQVYF